MKEPGPERLLTAAEVAELLNSDRQLVYCLTDAGVLPCIRLGRWLRYSPGAVRQFQDQGGITPEARAEGRRK